MRCYERVIGLLTLKTIACPPRNCVKHLNRLDRTPCSILERSLRDAIPKMKELFYSKHLCVFCNDVLMSTDSKNRQLYYSCNL